MCVAAATHTGIVLAHIILGTPFVVITVTATLTGFDHSVTRAASSLGSNPVNTFMKITLPLILPGVISGGLFALLHHLMKWWLYCSLRV